MTFAAKLFLVFVVALELSCAATKPHVVAGSSRPGFCAMLGNTSVDCFDDEAECTHHFASVAGTRCVPVQMMSCFSYREATFGVMEQCYSTHDACIERQSHGVTDAVMLTGCDGAAPDVRLAPNTCMMDENERPQRCEYYGLAKCNEVVGTSHYHCKTFDKLECLTYRHDANTFDECWPMHDDCLEHQREHQNDPQATITVGCAGGPVKTPELAGGACWFTDGMEEHDRDTCTYRDVATCEAGLASGGMKVGHHCKPVETFHCLVESVQGTRHRRCSATLDACFDDQADTLQTAASKLDEGCDGSPPSAPIPVPALRPGKECSAPAVAGGRWACSTTPCDAQRKTAVDAGLPAPSCKHVDKVHCFSIKNAFTRRQDLCFPTQGECAGAHKYFKEKTQDQILADCELAP